MPTPPAGASPTALQRTPAFQAGDATAVVEIDPAAPWRAVFEVYARGADFSPHTLKAYRRHVGAFFAWSGLQSPTQITPGLLAGWREELRGRYQAPASFSQAVSSLRSFMEFCRGFPAGEHLPGAEVLKRVFKPPKVRRLNPYNILGLAEQERLLDTATAWVWDYTDAAGRQRYWRRSEAIRTRDYAMLMVMLGSGLRVAELVGLDVSDLYETPDGILEFHIRQGKGEKERIVPSPADTTEAVRAHLQATGRQLGGSGPLFVATRGPGGRLSTNAVEAVVERLMRRARIQAKKITPHSLRHTFAVEYVRQTRDVVTLQQLMGHSSLETTKRYLDHVERQEKGRRMPLVRRAEPEG